MASRRLASWVASLALLGCDPGQQPRTDVGPPRAEITLPSEAPVPVAASEGGRPAVPEPPCKLVEPPSGFVDLREQIPSAIIVAGYHRADNFTGARLPGYEAAGAWLELDTASALARAAERLLEDDLRLLIYDAYRPQRASIAMVEWCEAHDRLDLLADGWVAARSAHARGIAVDLGLADADGTPLDMGSAWDQFDRQSHLRGVEGSALALRLRLRDELVRVGFEPYAREWWHFTHAGGRPSPPRDVAYACLDSASDSASDSPSD
jgi:D-alanyl-D-alanine dipeptidase